MKVLREKLWEDYEKFVRKCRADTSGVNLCSSRHYSVPICTKLYCEQQLLAGVHQFCDKQSCDVHDLACVRHPHLSLTSDSIARVHAFLVDDRLLTIRQLTWLRTTKICNPILRNTVHFIVKEDLTMQKVSVRWVLCQLFDMHMRQWMVTAIKFLTLYNQKGEAFVQRIVTGDKTQVHHYTPTTKRQSVVWKQSEESAPRKFKSQLSRNQIMLTVFWDRKGPLYREDLPYKKDEDVTQHRYFDILLCFHNAIWQK